MVSLRLRSENLYPRYILAASLIIVLVVTSHVMARQALSGGEEAARAINISGRQRSLSQRITHQTILEAQDPNDRLLTRSLDRTIDQFSASHDALYNGGAMGLTAEGALVRREAYEASVGAVTLHRRVLNYIETIDAARAGNPDALAEVRELAVSDAMVEDLDAAVRALQRQASEIVERAEFISLLSLVAALLVLVLEALFIFVPAQQKVTSTIRELRQSNDELKASRRELQTALGDADIARSHVENLLRERRSAAREAAQEISLPFSTLISSLHTLRAPKGDVVQEEELSEARNAVRRMRKALNAAFGEGGILASVSVLDESPVDIRQFVESLAVMTTRWADDKGLSFAYHVDESLPDMLVLDCPRMERVLSNLLSNAVKYTDSGSVQLKVCQVTRGLLRFAVEDTGVGIPADQVDRLFRSYRGEDQGTAHAATGTGLGLAICAELTQAMGGNINVESVVGEGTTVSLALPLKEPSVEEGSVGVMAI
ncbi:MAG: ATP-binding protein [Pseudomonadota bacterium]